MTDDDQEDEIEVCPDCKKASVKVNGTRKQVNPDAKKYRCARCGFKFDEPKTRKREGHTNTRRGLPGKLAALGAEADG